MFRKQEPVPRSRTAPLPKAVFQELATAAIPIPRAVGAESRQSTPQLVYSASPDSVASSPRSLFNKSPDINLENDTPTQHWRSQPLFQAREHPFYTSITSFMALAPNDLDPLYNYRSRSLRPYAEDPFLTLAEGVSKANISDADEERAERWRAEIALDLFGQTASSSRRWPEPYIQSTEDCDDM